MSQILTGGFLSDQLLMMGFGEDVFTPTLVDNQILTNGFLSDQILTGGFCGGEVAPITGEPVNRWFTRCDITRRRFIRCDI